MVAAKKAQVYLPRAFVVALWAGVTGQTVGDIIKKNEKKDTPVNMPAAATTTFGSIKLGQGTEHITKPLVILKKKKLRFGLRFMMTNSLKTLSLYGHGTHCIGTPVGGLGYGVAPGSKWIGCRNMNSGYGSPETYLACFQFFLAPTDLDGNNPDHTLRPHVIGNSWSCPLIEGCSGGEFAEVIANLKQAGVTSISSASNDGPSCGSMGNPATDINVISVASVKSDGTISSFSSRGPTTDGRVGPTISAPGSLVKSSTELSDSSYSTWSGTSMASRLGP